MDPFGDRNPGRKRPGTPYDDYGYAVGVAPVGVNTGSAQMRRVLDNVPSIPRVRQDAVAQQRLHDFRRIPRSPVDAAR